MYFQFRDVLRILHCISISKRLCVPFTAFTADIAALSMTFILERSLLAKSVSENPASGTRLKCCLAIYVSKFQQFHLTESDINRMKDNLTSHYCSDARMQQPT